jgi:hypothetical protein
VCYTSLRESTGSFRAAHQNEKKLELGITSCRYFPNRSNLLHKGFINVESAAVDWVDGLSGQEVA